MCGLGVVGHLRLTMCESNTFSLLAARAQNPSVLDEKALRHIAAFVITRKDVWITSYRSRESPNTSKCIEFHFFSDGSQNGVGPGQNAWILKIGPIDHPGGAFIAKSIKRPGLVADSVPVVELGMALKMSFSQDMYWKKLLVSYQKETLT